MWNLPLPENNDKLDNIQKAFTYKNGVIKYRLEDYELDIIKDIYSEYEKARGMASDRLLANNTLSNDTKAAFHEAYGEVQEDRRLEKLRNRLLLSAKRCPFCGIGSADELDHYLPRSTYKLLAIYSSNLVPICHTCNNKKRTVTGYIPSHRFLHIYCEQVPHDERFLAARTEMASGSLSVTFEIEQTNSLKDSTFDTLNFQIKRINLNERLSKEVNLFLSPLFISLEMVYGEKKTMLL